MSGIKIQANDPVQKKVDFHGIKVDVEWPHGSIRRYSSGFERKMLADYGYIRNSLGADGEELDCFIGDDHASTKVFLVAQLVGPYEIETQGATAGEFDEFKVILGCGSVGAAEGLFKLHIPSEQMGEIWEMTLPEFTDLVLPLIGAEARDEVIGQGRPTKASIVVRASKPTHCSHCGKDAPASEFFGAEGRWLHRPCASRGPMKMNANAARVRVGAERPCETCSRSAEKYGRLLRERGQEQEARRGLRVSVAHRIVTAGIVQDLKAAYPGLKTIIDELSRRDPSKKNKYLRRMVDLVVRGIDMDALTEIVGEFHRYNKLLPVELRDFNTVDWTRLTDALNDLEEVKRRRTRQKHEKYIENALGAESPVAQAGIVAKTNDWALVRIPSQPSAFCIGRGAAWCISQEESEYWHKYRRDGDAFYCFIPYEEKGGRIMIQISPDLDRHDFEDKELLKDVYNTPGQVTCWNEDDRSGSMHRYDVPMAVLRAIGADIIAGNYPDYDSDVEGGLPTEIEVFYVVTTDSIVCMSNQLNDCLSYVRNDVFVRGAGYEIWQAVANAEEYEAWAASQPDRISLDQKHMLECHDPEMVEVVFALPESADKERLFFARYFADALEDVLYHDVSYDRVADWLERNNSAWAADGVDIWRGTVSISDYEKERLKYWDVRDIELVETRPATETNEATTEIYFNVPARINLADYAPGTWSRHIIDLTYEKPLTAARLKRSDTREAEIIYRGVADSRELRRAERKGSYKTLAISDPVEVSRREGKQAVPPYEGTPEVRLTAQQLLGLPVGARVRALDGAQEPEGFVKQEDGWWASSIGGRLVSEALADFGVRQASTRRASLRLRRMSSLRLLGQFDDDHREVDEEEPFEPADAVFDPETPWHVRTTEEGLRDMWQDRPLSDEEIEDLILGELTAPLVSTSGEENRQKLREKVLPLLSPSQREEVKRREQSPYVPFERPPDAFTTDRKIPEPSSVRLEELPVKPDGGVENILAVLSKARPDEVRYWRSWYKHARADAKTIAEKFGVPTSLAAALIAILSPNTKWEENVFAAEQILRGQGRKVLNYRQRLDEEAQRNWVANIYPDLYVDRERLGVGSYMVNIAKAQRLVDAYEAAGRPKTFKIDVDLPLRLSWNPYDEKEAREAQKEYDRLVARGWTPRRTKVVTAPQQRLKGPDGKPMKGPDGKPLFVDRSRSERFPSGRLVHSWQADEVLPLGTPFPWRERKLLLVPPLKAAPPPARSGKNKGVEKEPPKVTAFYLSIMEPAKQQNTVVLDGHAINIWRGSPRNLSELKKHQPSVTLRQQMIADYREAAKQSADILGLKEPLTPQQVQAVTWTVWRDAVRGAGGDASDVEEDDSEGSEDAEGHEKEASITLRRADTTSIYPSVYTLTVTGAPLPSALDECP